MGTCWVCRGCWGNVYFVGSDLPGIRSVGTKVLSCSILTASMLAAWVCLVKYMPY